MSRHLGFNSQLFKNWLSDVSTDIVLNPFIRGFAFGTAIHHQHSIVSCCRMWDNCSRPVDKWFFVDFGVESIMSRS